MYHILTRTETITQTYAVFGHENDKDSASKAQIKIKCGPISQLEDKEGVVLLSEDDNDGTEVFLMGPAYKHDCEKCVFLGGFEEFIHSSLSIPKGIICGTWQKYDLYFCDGSIPTVIARYGDDGPDYISGLNSFKNIPALNEARNRTLKLGLIEE